MGRPDPPAGTSRQRKARTREQSAVLLNIVLLVLVFLLAVGVSLAWQAGLL